MKINTEGYIGNIRLISSPNCDERPAGSLINLLVIHYISLPPDKFGGNEVIDLFTNQLDPKVDSSFQILSAVRVSAHFFIRRDGETIQFVSCKKRAWHAGVSYWQGKACCNDFSIGVELEGNDKGPFTAKQYASLIAVTLALRETYPIEDITGHSDIAPGRKTDPGPYFDWEYYRTMLPAANHSSH
ncbi:MAG: 1,6-anhydro-N-acetylmuramyl-L-alanine amidase AmpD [Nitrosospira sp.]|nr:1,6-anhydro-N-acetylmuramyl-L-alanine amidase AmpD [Nitrosospira sp.]MDW7643139.1 1,6-anhydro-N-acetylmuramyl-L-alanine amidase AmpD [Nitrosomonadaceae bacterium]MBI0407901.1 1,6-anhydro-N-acetylmuramyl-L-alanine amidase AmpD [Nitrosospira sp.]MBI0415568.1 1,6-anhydro-N-acetylmuramyl-L-alanine amidase AmpD [Nitrosospira sp.]MBI0417634.1 1,6-anhydro-N-acetylmuramyl-L-alanine amidase AmpD [Nitrosospira sp.]